MKILSTDELDVLNLVQVEPGLRDYLQPLEPGYTGPVRFDLIDAKIAWAEAEDSKPDEERQWNQKEWVEVRSCGTARCIAGDVVLDEHSLSALYNDRGEQNGDLEYVHIDGNHVLISDEATRLLGLQDYGTPGDYGDYPLLFDSDNSIRDLKRYRDAYARLEGYPLKYTGEAV